MFDFKYLNMFIYLNSDLNGKMEFLLDIILNIWVLLVVQWQRILLPMQETQETWVRSLRWENPLRRKWLPTPVFSPEKIPWTEELGRLKSMGLQKSQTPLSD